MQFFQEYGKSHPRNLGGVVHEAYIVHLGYVWIEERYFSIPIPFLVLEMTALICAEKVSFESRITPRCLCSSTSFTGVLLNRITG